MTHPRRVLLKISGEAFSSPDAPLCQDRLAHIVSDIRDALAKRVEIAIVVGGGNFLRGATTKGVKRITADHMAMLATIINGLALRDALDQGEIPVKLYSAIEVAGIAARFDYAKAISALHQGKVVILVAGTGNPFVTTDSGASLRAVEIDADVILKATKVDGVYNKDPRQHSDAILYSSITFDEVLRQELEVMDLAAFCQCRDYQIDIQVFNLFKKGALLNALLGGREGTLVSNKGRPS
jgi:uridylate kinase